MRNENSKETILKEALQLFSLKGYDGVSVSEIVKMANITKPTLYYFFGSKEGLLQELLETHYTKLHGNLQKVCRYHPYVQQYDKDVFPVLVGVVKMYFTFAQNHKDFYLMRMSLFLAPPTSKAAQVAHNYQNTEIQYIHKMFTEISRCHTNLLGHENNFTWSFISVVDAYIGNWYRNNDSLSENLAQSIVKQFMHGIFSL